MARDDHRFSLLIPPDLKDELAQAAKINRRSLTSEILYRCEYFGKLTEKELSLVRVTAKETLREVVGEAVIKLDRQKE